MPTPQNYSNNSRSDLDNKILQKQSVVAWLATLDKEFALHRLQKSTRKAYRLWIVSFILWKYRTRSMGVAEEAIRDYLTYLAQVAGNNRSRGYYCADTPTMTREP